MSLYHHSIGTGPELVMLHGWGLHSAIWSASDDHLATRLAKHFRVTMIDLPGHGLSNDGDRGFSFTAAVDAVAELLPASCNLLGWSLGGLLALQLAHRLSKQINRLVLLTSTARFTQADDWPTALPPTTLNNFATALLSDQPGTVQRFLALQVRGSDNERQQLRLLKQALAQHPAARPAALASGLECLASIDLRSRLATITQPALLLYGQHDRIVPAAAGTALATMLPQAHSHTITGAGHAPFLSHPGDCEQLILDFLNDG